MLEIISRASEFKNDIAIVSGGENYQYQTLLAKSKIVAACLLKDKTDLNDERIAFLVEPGFDYVKIQWGIWQAGGIAVPLNPGSPLSNYQYVIEDSQATTIITSTIYSDMLQKYSQDNGLEFFTTDAMSGSEVNLPDVSNDRPAMILYTSGTTGSPKGVVTTHANIATQIKSLIEAWRWSSSDSIVNILPLHHVHGIINVVSCSLWSGATCYFQPKFEPKLVLDLINDGKINLFMAVPTIYFKMIAYWQVLDKTTQLEIGTALSKMRLMVSGSAALPISILEKWQKISGHTLLERYGMTEIGMAISNPYDGIRQPGHIGQPLPNVELRLVDDHNTIVKSGDQGEIQVKGPAVFMSYWNRPEATKEAFTKDGWFRTGDIAIWHNRSYKILGRSSIDIIKSGGYKISALEIEEVLRKYEGIKDCAVIGIPDEEWGEIIGAGLILSKAQIDQEMLKTWLKKKLPAYKTPRRFQILEDLPRNAMGKVTKKDLKELFKD
jgi:malonyl-CoA/methylmalonyl-CoA synthetase